uniref:Uncharacterized protein n=1 Tax=Setaria digitata TaxID=48799 RepID=A0A915PIV7_9BILA
MEVSVAMGIIVIHTFCKLDLLKEKFTTLAKCVVVSQHRENEENSTATDEMITNEITLWTSTTTPCYYCDHGHLRDQYEEQYQIIANMTVAANAEDRKVFHNTDDGQKRWRAVITEAMELQQAKHYKQASSVYHSLVPKGDNNPAVDVQQKSIKGLASRSGLEEDTKILKTQCSTRTCTQTFVVLYNDKPIPAEIVVSDLSLLSLSRISARLRIPVESITTLLPHSHGKSQWWIIAVVLGLAAGIIAAGWLCLFIYYNSCGRPYATKPAQKPLINTIFLKDELIQTAENDNDVKYFDIQRRDSEGNKRQSPKAVASENGSISTMRKGIQDASAIDVISAAAITATSTEFVDTTTNKKCFVTTKSDSHHHHHHQQQQQLDYPISIVTRPRRREDPRIHKLRSLSDISVPTLKEIYMEEKLHPHPIPPTISGILEVKTVTEQMNGNPMSCL